MKSFDVLAYLVEHHGELVTKAALMDAVWPHTAVTDNSLAQCIAEIRRALDDESQQLIRTVARRGYHFTASVSRTVPDLPQHKSAPPTEHDLLPQSRPSAQTLSSRYVLGFAALLLAALVLGSLLFFRSVSAPRQDLSYTQITNFSDSALAPALSPDGRMVAFYRSNSWFHTPDQIYVKLLPDGEPVQLTNDPNLKYGLAFSPDGSRIAYTALQGGYGWRTFTVSPLGGEPRLLLSNAAGLTWLDQRRVLFSEIRTGTAAHMGIVTATEQRAEYRSCIFRIMNAGWLIFPTLHPIASGPWLSR
jgi:DNA-binding winged helix-turn-helix (wHTH) protein